MNNGLLLIGALLVAFFTALFAVPMFVDWNGYRGVFEEEASKVLGRDVRVGGDVNLRLLPAPYVRFEKVRMSDTTGQTGEPFVRIESFTMWLSGPALLRGVLEASRIDLEKPVLTLALDGQGAGNWSTLELKPGDLPFVPRDVALRSVNVKDGAIAIYDADTQRIARIDAVDGELSADSIRGPFRFKGHATWSDTRHDVKFATTTPSPDGSFRIKTAVSAPALDSNYVVDGLVEHFTSKPQLTGTLSAKVAVPGVEAVPAGGDGAAAGAVPVFDVQSSINANADGATFDGVTLSLDDAVEPQIITGVAKSAWAGGTTLDVTLNSKWLDLDRLSGAGDDSAKFVRVRRMVLGMMKAVAGEGRARTRIDVEQVKVGGETAGGLVIDAERTGSVLKFKTLKAGLPGGTRLDVMGDLKDNGGVASFTGRGFVRGTSLARLKAWAGKSGATIDITADGAFSAEGNLTFSDKVFELADANGEINGQPISGSIKVSDGETRRLDVSLESAKLDTRDFFPETARAIEAALLEAAGASPAKGEAAAKPFDGDMKLRLLAGELVTSRESFHDVDVDITFDRNAVQVQNARLTSSKGLAIGVEGRVKMQDGIPRGTLGFDLAAASPEALGDAPRLFGVEEIVDGKRLAMLGEAKIAGLAKLGARLDHSVDVSFGGMSRGARVTGNGELDGGFEKWRQAPSRMGVTVNGPSLQAISAFAGIKQNVPAGAGADAAAAQAVLMAAGVIGDDMAISASVTSQDFDVGYDGRGSWPDGKALLSQGTVKIKALNASDILVLAGAAPGAAAGGVKAEGSLDIARDGSNFRIATRGFGLGVAKIDGSADVTAQGDPEPAIVRANLNADHVDFTGLLSALTDAAPAPAQDKGDAVETATGGDRPLWPAGLFNFALLDGVSGDVALKFKRLDVSGNLATGDGQMVIKLTPQSVEVSDLKAEAVGGTLTSAFKLDKARDGVSLDARLALEGADLGRLSAKANGQGSIDVSAKARAQSPAGLVAVMAGAGTVSVKDAVIPAPPPGLASNVAETVIDGSLANEIDPITAVLGDVVAKAHNNFGTREIAITIADGAAKFAPITFDNPRGDVRVATSVDLMSLGFTSSWFLSSVIPPLRAPEIPLPGYVPPPPKGPLPPVVVAYTGRLDDLGGLSAVIDAGEFQRELAVRQMERSVKELELLRRTDEERARLDKERRKAAEEARAAAEAAEKEAAHQRRAAEEAQPIAPPVLPESQNPPSSAEPGAGAAAPASGDTPKPQPATGALPSTGDGAAAPPQQQDGTDSQSKVITVEPIPEAQGLDSAATPVVRPTARPRPAQRAQRPRTATEELMRSLGVP